ncbi:MAG: glycosyltransferase family 4 protein [Immundisolibacteraceae bacterium]|nr:glycosyltransferase family 4 protein [Immundisolibacteraceae bacterium]
MDATSVIQTRYRLLVIAKDRNGSSTRYRAGQFAAGIQAAGWQVEIMAVGSDVAGRWQMISAARQADVVWVLRKTFGPVTTKLLRLAAKRLIFDFDDAIFLASNGNPSSTRYQRFKRMVCVADRVWAGNDFLAEESRLWNKQTELMPTVVDETSYQLADQRAVDNGVIDLVWIGSSSTRKYLEKLIPVLDRLAELRPELRLKIVADFDLPNLKMSQQPVDWNEQIEIEALLSCHIGIAPMIDNPWTRGKCGLKVLQYMAAGLPVVTDAAGVNQEMVTDGATGFIVSSHEQWCSAILSLTDDPEKRVRMGEHGLKRLLSKNYTRSAQIVKILQRLADLTN